MRDKPSGVWHCGCDRTPPDAVGRNKDMVFFVAGTNQNATEGPKTKPNINHVRSLLPVKRP
jgi:hypothetical protein